MSYAVIVLLLIILSGDFFATTVLNRKFGEITPCTILIYGFIVYIAGIFQCLNVGIVFSSLLTISAYLFSIVFSVKQHRFMEGLRNFVSIPFFCFLFLFVLLLFGDFKQLTTGYDDPGHWMDCVKVMIYSGEFYANPETHSTFPTYPPMMAVIQLLVQKQYLMITGGEFCEWLMFLTYHVVTFSLFLPFITLLNKGMEEKNSRFAYRGIYCIVFSIVLCTTVTVFFRTVHSRVGIDPFLACAGTVVFLAILYKEKIKDFYLYIYLLLPAVVLIKDMGLLFAVFGLVYLMVDSFKEKQVKPLFISTVLVAVSKISWNSVIKYYGAVDPKPNKVNFGKYIKVLFGIEKYSELYKNESIAAFRTALVDRAIKIGNRGVPIKYIIFISIIFLLTVVLCYVFRNNRKIILNSIISYA